MPHGDTHRNSLPSVCSPLKGTKACASYSIPDIQGVTEGFMQRNPWVLEGPLSTFRWICFTNINWSVFLHIKIQKQMTTICIRIVCLNVSLSGCIHLSGGQDLDPTHGIQYILNVATFFDSRKGRMKKSSISKELLLKMRSYDYLYQNYLALKTKIRFQSFTPGRAGNLLF